VKEKAAAITGEHKWYVERIGITQGLLHARTKGVFVVFSLKRADWFDGKEQSLHGGLHTAMSLPRTMIRPDLFANLLEHVPARLRNGRDVFAATVAFGE